MMTAAKMVLHDWQRGRIPFFMPPPKQEDESSIEPSINGVDKATAEKSNKASAAFKAIANVVSSQQQMTVPVQRDLFSETELKGGTREELPTSKGESQQLPAAQSMLDDQLPVSES